MTAYSEKRCRDFIEALSALIASHTAGDPHGGHQNDSWPTAGEVVECIEDASLTASEFIELDERPGAFDPMHRQHGWHMLLCEVRNNKTIDLFGDVLLP